MEETLKFDDVKAITVPRSRLLKWLREPFFDSIASGSFVRVGIGRSRSGLPLYRLCMIKNVDSSKPNRQYRIGSLRTNKWLNCVWGNEASAARWQVAMVSDHPPLEEEFRAWYQEVQWTAGRLPTLDQVREKKVMIQRINGYSIAASEKRRMMESRKEEERAVRLVEMNMRNRKENFWNASEARAVDSVSLRAGDEGYDPFSRRWTRPQKCCVSSTRAAAVV